MLSVLNREMESRYIHLGVPHCWYRWGDEVVRILMPKAISWVHEDPSKTTVTWEADPPDVPEGSTTHEVLAQRIAELVHTFAAPGAIEELVNIVYSYAPFPFQDAYRQVRNAFIDIRGAEVLLTGLTEAVVGPVFKRAMDVFPVQDFPDLKGRSEPFRAVMSAWSERMSKA